ncbi:MAG: hypothetical protein CM15mP2_2690 [Methanobacteriota archaeon]|nr:MAG: hypothetical protein CM15mP2_2690 [Euryarchaeota archaeon]
MPLITLVNQVAANAVLFQQDKFLANAARNVAIPPCFGWLVIIGKCGLPSNICVANILSARLDQLR